MQKQFGYSVYQYQWSFYVQSDQSPESLKAELRAILPQTEEMRKRIIDRKNQFIEVLEEIHSIKNEIKGQMVLLQTIPQLMNLIFP